MEDGRPRPSNSSAVGPRASFFSLPHERGARARIDLIYPGGHFKSLPPSRCTCKWNTDWPAPGPTFNTVR
jgi:hypothetical protein